MGERALPKNVLTVPQQGRIAGRFTSGCARQFVVRCKMCLNVFTSASGNSRWCASCRESKRVCAECLGVKSEYNRFCGKSCAGKWGFRGSKAVRDALAAGAGAPQRTRNSAIGRRNKARPDMVGQNNPNWRGGSSAVRRSSYGDHRYVLWRRAVFLRDDWTCQDCKCRGGQLNAHHKQRWSDCPERRFDVTNGVTLCIQCHRYQHRLARAAA